MTYSLKKLILVTIFLIIHLSNLTLHSEENKLKPFEAKGPCELRQTGGIVAEISDLGFWIKPLKNDNESKTEFNSKIFVDSRCFIHPGTVNPKVGEAIVILYYPNKNEGLLLKSEAEEYIRLFNWIEGTHMPPRTLRTDKKPTVFGAFLRYPDREYKAALKAIKPLIEANPDRDLEIPLID